MDAAALHREQLKLFRREVKGIEPLLSELAPGRDVLYGGTLSAQSGRALAMIAPLAHIPARDLVRNGGMVGVLWLTAGSQQSRVESKLRPGVYGLRLDRERGDAASLKFLNAKGDVAHTAPGILKLAGGDGLWEKIKRILKKLGLDDLNLVDIEVLFGGDDPSEVRASVLFWSFHLFDDP